MTALSPRRTPPLGAAVARAVLTTTLALATWAGDALAQNPIASKIVGSSVARRNRKLLSRFDRRPASDPADTIARGARGFDSSGTRRPQTTVVSVPQLRLAKLEVDAILASSDVDSSARSGALQATCVGQTLGARVTTAPQDTLSPVYQLERLCATPELRGVVPEALRGALSALHQRTNGAANTGVTNDSLATTDLVVQALAWEALGRVLRAVEKGHTNPDRLFLGGQLGLRLVGDRDPGVAARASVRAAYFIPISPFRRWQLPVVTNLRDVGSAAPELQADKLRKVTTASEGAFLSLEPTWDRLTFGRWKDVTVQPFLAVGGQLNTLRALEDTSKHVQFGQGRVGVGANFEVGIAEEGRPNLFLTTRVVQRFYSPSASQQVFGTRNRGTPVVETIALVPIGGATSILGEVSAARRTAPVVRIGLWSQTTPKALTGQVKE